MTAPKRTEITVETNRIVTIRGHLSQRIWCTQCAREVDVVDPEEAAVLAALAQLKLPEPGSAEQWHLCQGTKGETLVCLESLKKSL